MQKKSYNQIIKSSSITGGVAAITMVLGMIRLKFAAILISFTGVGLLSSFSSIQGLIGTVAGMGIQSSAVREIAIAVAKGDEQEIGRKVLTLRRICWITGLAGMLIMIAFSSKLSQLTFNSSSYSIEIAALGFVILLTNLTSGQLVLLQGARCIRSLASIKLIGAIFSTLTAISFYYFFGLRGIVPSMICIASIQFLITWSIARKIPVPQVTISWFNSLHEAKGMINLGIVFMLSALLVTAVNYGTITLITRQFDLHSVGLYSAAFTISGIFVNFVLDSMGADYYPRLAGISQDKVVLNRLVNEQAEVGIMLSLPGLLVTLVFSPWILKLFFSFEFIGAVDLLQWFVIGCLGRLISWPMAYILIALGEKRMLFLTETFFNVLHFVLIFYGLKFYGLVGIGIAFAVLYIAYTFAMRLLANYLTNFNWTPTFRKVLFIAITSTLLCFIFLKFLPTQIGVPLGFIITLLVSLFYLRRLIVIFESVEQSRLSYFKIIVLKLTTRFYSSIFKKNTNMKNK